MHGQHTFWKNKTSNYILYLYLQMSLLRLSCTHPSHISQNLVARKEQNFFLEKVELFRLDFSGDSLVFVCTVFFSPDNDRRVKAINHLVLSVVLLGKQYCAILEARGDKTQYNHILSSVCHNTIPNQMIVPCFTLLFVQYMYLLVYFFVYM